MIPSRAKAKTIAAMAHQKVSLAHDARNPIVYDTSDPGTGKTAVRVWGFAARRRKGGGRALVLGPRTILKNTWQSDFRKFAPDMLTVVAPAEKREQAFATPADAYITNHDAVKWLVKQKAAWWKAMGFSELIVDEPTAYKHHASQRSRAMLKISRMKIGTQPVFPQRKAMTATPNSNGICDIWHQAMILDHGKRLGDSYFAFRNTTCTPVQVGRNQQAVQWRDKDGAEEAVFGLLSDIVVRHKFEDCVDIPATHHYTVDYELPSKLAKTYETMEDAQLLVLGIGMNQTAGAVANKITTGSPKITAINAAAVATKLLQICSGAVYENPTRFHVLDTGRYELLLDMVEQRKHSLLFFQWKHQRDQLVAEAVKRGVTHCVLDGNATDKEREAMVQGYQAGLYQVMFAHPRSAAHGLTLTKGTSIIWAGPIYDLELFEQGNKRQARIGQKQKTEVVVVIAKGTLEEKVYELLMAKNIRMSNLLDLFASIKPLKKAA